MIERLGNVLYWTFGAVAAGIAGFIFYVIIEKHGRLGLHEMADPMVLMGFGVAGAFWLVGAALRYILTGRGI